MAGESTTLSVSGFSSCAGRDSGTSLGVGDTGGMTADCSSSSEEDSDEEDEEEEEEEEDEEEEELLLSESDVLPFSPSESAYREHWEDESLSSSSPGNPEETINGQAEGSFTKYSGCVALGLVLEVQEVKRLNKQVSAHSD